MTRSAGFLLMLMGLIAGCSGSDSRPAAAPPAKPDASPPAAHGSSSTPPAAPARRIPPYHENAKSAQPYPKLLPAGLFRDYPAVARAYQIASQIPGVIAQQPCFCYCDKFGHRSLLDCYASDHGAG